MAGQNAGSAMALWWHRRCLLAQADLLVTFIPEDMPDEPFGGRHFKKGMPKVFEPEPVTVHLTVQQQL